MNKRLIFFEGVYDTLDLFSEELRKIYEAMGFETMVMYASEMEESLGKLMQFALAGVDAVITFNNLGFYLELSEGKNLWEELGIPCINILMDHPFRYHRFLVQAPANGIVLCTDENHMKYVKRFYPNIKRVGFLPHGGILPEGNESAGGGAEPRSYKPIAERSIDVLYAGSLSRYVAEGLVPDLGDIIEYDGFALSQEVLSELIRCPNRTTEEVIEEYLVNHGHVFTDDHLREEITRLRFLDVYATAFYREQTVRYLVEHGVQVTVYGQGWTECEWADNPNLHYGGIIPPAEIVRKMQDSKIVLNTMTWFKAGAHDRIFNGMLAGAGVVTDTSSYVEEHFTDGEELALFHLQGLSQLPDMVGQLLEQPERLQRMADAGYQRALKEHTWQQRAEEILKLLS